MATTRVLVTGAAGFIGSHVADALLRRNLLIWGLGGVIAPFVGIKLIDLVLGALMSLTGM